MSVKLFRKTIRALGFAALLAAAVLVSARGVRADSGWVERGGKYYYQNAGGKYVTGVRKIGKSYYYFNKNGVLRTRFGWQKAGKRTCYVMPDSTLAVGVQKIGRDTYIFGKNGAMRNGSVRVGTRVWYLTDDGKAEAYKEGKTYYYANGKKMSRVDAYDYETFQTAKRIAARITNDGMSKAQKLRRCFNWVMKKYYITKRKFTSAPGWIPLYANDHFHGKGGTCLSDAAAFGYLAKAVGYKNVYACLDSPRAGGHAWTEINGRVYDPLFAQAKSYSKYYGATYKSYRLSPSVRVRMS